MAIGAISAGISKGIGDIAGNIGGLNSSLFQNGAHGLVQGGLSVAQGGNFQSGLSAGLFGSISAGNGGSPLDMIGLAAFIGGMSAQENGGNFWQGAA